VRALAFKWIRILYRCWQTRTPYDEATYLNALRRRRLAATHFNRGDCKKYLTDHLRA
jgi:hypothetical protein